MYICIHYHPILILSGCFPDHEQPLSDEDPCCQPGPIVVRVLHGSGWQQKLLVVSQYVLIPEWSLRKTLQLTHYWGEKVLRISAFQVPREQNYRLLLQTGVPLPLYPDSLKFPSALLLWCLCEPDLGLDFVQLSNWAGPRFWSLKPVFPNHNWKGKSICTGLSG